MLDVYMFFNLLQASMESDMVRVLNVSDDVLGHVPPL